LLDSFRSELKSATRVCRTKAGSTEEIASGSLALRLNGLSSAEVYIILVLEIVFEDFQSTLIDLDVLVLLELL
jgi:hypothetical protein